MDPRPPPAVPVPVDRRPHGLDRRRSARSSCSSCSAAWWTSIPSPLATVAPARSRRREPRRLGWVVDEVDHHLPGDRGATGRPARPSPARARPRHADRSGVDHQVAARLASAADPTRPTGPASAAAATAALGRPVDHHHLGRARVGQGGDHRPGRAPGADDRQRRPAGSKPRPRASAATSPAPSVLSPRRRAVRRRSRS